MNRVKFTLLMKMSWVPITAIQDLSENLQYLTPEEVDDVLNNLAVSRSYRGVTHYRLSDVERALRQLPNIDQNALMYIRSAAVVVSNGNNGGQRPGNNGNNGRSRPGNNGGPMPNIPMPSGEGGVYIYLDANTFRNLFRPCQ